MTSPSKDMARVEHTPTECDCISRVNKLLAEHNAMLMTNLLGEPRATITTDKVDSKKRGRPPIMQATYCPFCGEKYQEQKATTLSRIKTEG